MNLIEVILDSQSAESIAFKILLFLVKEMYVSRTDFFRQLIDFLKLGAKWMIRSWLAGKYV